MIIIAAVIYTTRSQKNTLVELSDARKVILGMSRLGEKAPIEGVA